MRELQEAVSYAAQHFGHSLCGAKHSLPLQVHRAGARSPILIVTQNGTEQLSVSFVVLK
jgi:hypothetical protein